MNVITVLVKKCKRCGTPMKGQVQCPDPRCGALR